MYEVICSKLLLPSIFYIYREPSLSAVPLPLQKKLPSLELEKLYALDLIWKGAASLVTTHMGWTKRPLPKIVRLAKKVRLLLVTSKASGSRFQAQLKALHIIYSTFFARVETGNGEG